MKIVPTNLSNWKSKVYKLDGDELAPIPVDLSKLSIVVKMMSLKKMYIMLRSKILKIKYWITNLATTVAHTAVEIKIPSLYLDYNKNYWNWKNKITTDHNHDKCIITLEFKKLKSENFTAGLTQANLLSENYITNFIKKGKLWLLIWIK